VHERRGDLPVLLEVDVERGELLDVLDEHGGGRPRVEAKVDESRLGRRQRLVMIDDGEHLDARRVGEIRVEIQRVDEGEKIDLARVVDALDLLELEPEQLDEGAVLAVTELVAVANGRARDAET
jgi:hypothetical protein